MFKGKMRLLGMSALVGAGLIAAGPASAANVQLGGWDVQIDNTVSAGMSWLTKDVEQRYLPLANGGPADNSVYFNATAPTTVPACDTSYGAYCQEVATMAVPNFDGSINSDDGRLNFDQGDAYSAPLRLTTEIEANKGALRAFARINAWYDVVAMDNDSYNRGGSLDSDGIQNAGTNIELLDAFLSYDGDLGDMPFTLRAGRQVINWGEATFIPGGNSAFNPIDVAALRRPGAEIKEALLPVEALYGSIAITQDLSLEAYVGGWGKYRLEAGGTPMGISDSFTDGVSGGNPKDLYFIGGGPNSGDKFACTGDTAFANSTEPHLQASLAVISAIKGISGAVACSTGQDVATPWTSGNAEVERFAAGDTNVIKGIEDKDGKQSVGLALRYYSEALNSTEFALYYQKGDSRLPYISYQTGKADIKATSTTTNSSTVGRGAGVTGCFATFGATGGFVSNPAYATTFVDDSKGILAGIQATADTLAANIPGYTRPTNLPANSVALMQDTTCILALTQTNSAVTLGSAFDGFGQLHTGATNIGASANMSLFAEFPEVETYGASFNTTLLGWGVQGDFAYRPDVPLQHDTDVLTIASLFNNCLFASVSGLEATYLSGSTYHKEYGGVGCTDDDKYLKGYSTEHDAFTWDIGTTATFTRSNPVVSFLRSDLGIFLTEFQGVEVDGIEDDRGNTGALGLAGNAPLGNVCVGGSDLPLNGILSIDDRTAMNAADATDDNPKGYCRPTDSSYGVVLMAQLQYNNVFGTPIGLKPQVVFSHGLDGFSPSPVGFWREDTGSTAFSLTADYLGSLSANISYRTYHGKIERTKMLDRDNLSVSVTYAF
jgi:hypothetical protein